MALHIGIILALTQALHWRYIMVALALHGGGTGITMALQLLYNGAAQWRCIDVNVGATMPLQLALHPINTYIPVHPSTHTLRKAS